MVSLGPEPEFYSRLYQLSRAAESRDLDRIAAFYAPDATSNAPGPPERNVAGLAAIRATAGTAFARVRAIRVSLTDAVQVRPIRGQVTTSQGFHVEWTTADGGGWTWDGRHVATWERRGGVLLIVHEELLDRPVFRGARPPDEQAPAPAPTRVESTASPEPEPEPVSAVPEAPPPSPRPDPRLVESASVPVPAASRAKAGSFSTHDWAGDPVFVVHIGSFQQRPAAARHSTALVKETGLPARAVQVDLGAKGTWYRSVVGEFRSLPEALAAREGLIGKRVADVGLVYRMTGAR